VGLSRSAQMSRIRATNTKPELALRKRLWAVGFRYVLHVSKLPGRPDLVFRSRRVAVFVDGCFWHGCPDHYVRPRSRTDFWCRKLEANFLRDRRQTTQLELMGWRVHRIWEHELIEGPEAAVERLCAAINSPAIRTVSWRVVKACQVPRERNVERWILKDLRNPGRARTVHRTRSTKKVGRPVRVGTAKSSLN
jgi:DNA mismatch endonuclease (patch repair protein)